jgi:hypothetical protein
VNNLTSSSPPPPLTLMTDEGMQGEREREVYKFKREVYSSQLQRASASLETGLAVCNLSCCFQKKKNLY